MPEPRTNTAISPLCLSGSTTSEKDKRSYKEVEELLLLHRRYEQNALRLFRKGLTVEEAPELARQAPTRAITTDTALNKSSTETRGKQMKHSSKLYREDTTEPLYLNDKDYLKQLLLRDDANGTVVDRWEPQKWDNTSRAQLRLPKLESIPPENKEIFYTTLPKVPPLPKLKETKVKATKPHRKKKRSRYNSVTVPSTFSSAKCLTVRQLPSDHFLLHDFEPGTKSSSISSVPRLPRITQSSKTITTEAISADEGCLWLVPVVNIEIPSYRLAKWNEIENGNLSTEEDQHKELLEIQAGVDPGRVIEVSQPKYKRNVHFSEFLHEIHLYSPMSTTQSAMSKEDINGH